MAFPPGFRMIAGDAGKRNAFVPPPDIPQSLWGPDEKTPKALAEKAIGFNCLNSGGSAEGSLTRHWFQISHSLIQTALMVFALS
jgi:hypothetical protein